MFDVLQTILPIPSAPIQNDEQVLLHNQQILGIEFPSDFVNFSRLYGSGEISDDKYSWEIVSGASPSFSTFVSEFHETFGDFRDAYQPYTVPLHLFPEPNEQFSFGYKLFPFGCCANGVWWCWKSCGPPDTWTVVDISDWEYGFCSYPMGFAEFLVKLLRAQIQLPGRTLRSDPNKVVTFTPKEL